MATVARTLALNAAFLQEIKQDHQELWSLVRTLHDRFRTPGGRGSAASMLRMLSELRDRLAMHFALEEAYGYFDDPLDVAPRLSEQLNRLRDEHGDLYRDVLEVVDLAERAAYHEAPTASIGGHLRQRFLRFHDRLRRHEEAERDLLMESLEADIGVGD